MIPSEKTKELVDASSEDKRAIIATCRDMIEDSDRPHRMQAMMCRVCYYMGHLVGVVASQTCMVCGGIEDQSNLRVCCKKCSKKHKYCVKCLAMGDV
jgi:hypothetical protein